jgi:DNA-directed DNA polymerase III PolC
MRYVSLHTHSEYSLLDGASQLASLVEQAKNQDMSALAVTDHGVMYGAVELLKKCRAAGIKPIVGTEAYVINGDIADRSRRYRRYHQVLLAKNLQGYKNLVKLVTVSHLQGIQGKGIFARPCINKELLQKHHAGLIVTSACLGGEIPQYILAGRLSDARSTAQWYKDLFGDDFYLEIQDHGQREDRVVNVALAFIGRELGIKLVATNDSHFTSCEDVDAHDALLCIQTGKLISEENRMRYTGTEYLKTAEEMARMFRDHLDDETIARAIEASQEIADKVERYEKDLLGEPRLPQFPIPRGYTAESYLEEVTWQGMRERFGDQLSDEYRDRLKYELAMIERMGFSTYFLVVWDYIKYARDNGIAVGPGRGSAAGSLVAYALRITNIDPVRYNLLFERFLNPERKSMPDIDTDFCIERRNELIDYVTRKYGAEYVAQIITFNRMTSKAVLKDVARVLDIPYGEADKLAKLIPVVRGKPVKLTKMISDETPAPEFKQAYESDERVKKWVDLAMRLENTNKTFGVHAAGVVISRDPLDEIVPLQRNNEGQVITQYYMEDIADLGLLKMDFLGLRNLTMIRRAQEMIERYRGEQVDLDNLPLDDSRSYELLGKADLEGIFQLESSGMKAIVQDLRPSNIEDISAILALYRPGPLDSGMIPEFIARKHGRKKIEYAHPLLEPILSDTYGSILYQEQIMKIAQDLGGYTLGQADLLRRCLSGSTEVIDAATGRIVTLAQIADEREYWLGREVFSLELKTQQIVRRPIEEIYTNGVQDVWEITTRTGRKIRATATHPFYTLLTWKTLGQLKVGDYIGLSRSLPVEHTSSILDAQIKLVAYLIGDGHLSETEPVRCLSRHRVKNFAVALKDSRLERISQSEIFWDSIISIEYIGKEAVFDLTIPETHNFIANHFIVHNCMGKKKKDEMEKHRSIFVEGCAKNGVPSHVAQDLFEQMVVFAEYCLSYDTEIQTLEYGPLPIGKIVSLNIDCTVLSIDENGHLFSQPIAQWHDRGRQEVFEYLLEDGTKIRATKDHKFMTTDGKMFPIHEIFESGLDLLKVDMEKPTEVVKVVSCKSLGVQPVYDIGVEREHNFLLSNGLLASNCFNKSHSAAYGFVTFQTAYLKAHYPVEYMAALLSSVQSDLDKVQKYISSCMAMGIQIEPPDINRSGFDFTPLGTSILFGLGAVKGVGEGAIHALLTSREQHGTFKDLADLCDRVDLRTVNKRALEALVRAGAFDRFNANRAQLLADLEVAIDWAQSRARDREIGQSSLFDLFGGGGAAASQGAFKGPTAPQVPDLDPAEKLKWERELLGFYISDHPLKAISQQARLLAPISLADLGDHPAETKVSAVVLVREVKGVVTKKGDRMAIVQLEDLSGSTEAVIFPKMFERVGHHFAVDARLMIWGKVDFRDDRPQLLIDDAEPVEEVQLVVIDLEPRNDMQTWHQIRELLQTCQDEAKPPKVPVIASLRVRDRHKFVRFGPQFRVSDPRTLIEALRRKGFNARAERLGA